MALFGLLNDKSTLPKAANALPGRDAPIATASHHYINGKSLHPPYPENMSSLYFGMGCFWGAERLLWNIKGVHITAVGYSAGITPNPTYEEVCSGKTGHNEVVLVVYDAEILSHDALMRMFWESHNPTQGMRQGNDRGTQYRSGIYTTNTAQIEAAKRTRDTYQAALSAAGMDAITTEIVDADTFYFAEEYHQQYLEKNPNGYCGIGGTGIACAIGTGVES